MSFEATVDALSAVELYWFRTLGARSYSHDRIGVAERTSSRWLKVLVTRVPSSFLTATVVFAGVMSSMAADAGYVVLTPLGALLFASVNRHPLAGLAAAYAGVSGGYSANLLITGLDPMLSALTDQAANTLDHAYGVNPACIYSWWSRPSSSRSSNVGYDCIVDDAEIDPSQEMEARLLRQGHPLLKRRGPWYFAAGGRSHSRCARAWFHPRGSLHDSVAEGELR